MVSKESVILKVEGTEYMLQLSAEEQIKLAEGTKTSKWTDASIKVLIRLVNEKSLHLPNSQEKKKKELWEEVAVEMAEMGYHFTWNTVNKKWANILDTYKNIKDRQNNSGYKQSTWLYFDLIDSMLGDRYTIQPSRILCSGSIENPPRACGSISPTIRAGDKRKLSVSGRSEARKARYMRRDSEDVISARKSCAPDWFREYSEKREKADQEWKEEMRKIMLDRNAAITKLADAVSALVAAATRTNNGES